MLLSLGLWPRISGQFPKNGPFIIMMNHTSFVDVFIFPLIPVGHYTGVTAIENFNYPTIPPTLHSFRMLQLPACTQLKKHLVVNSIP